MKSFFTLFSEAGLPPMPPPAAGGGLPPLPPSGGAGGLPPMPKLPPMGGGLGGGLPPMGGAGGPSPQQEPAKLKTISVSDVWSMLDNASKNMEKYPQLNLKYFRKKEKETETTAKSSLLS